MKPQAKEGLFKLKDATKLTKFLKIQPIAIIFLKTLLSYYKFSTVSVSIHKEVTIYDIAHQLGISSSTVSRALKNDPVVNIKTKQKIFELAKSMGYRTNNFARNLRTRKTFTIGVIVPRLNSYFMSSVISGIESIANREGYNLIISQSAESVEKEIANTLTMFNNRVDGLLVSLAYDTEDTSHFQMFSKKHIPVISFDRMLESNSCTNVLIDNRRAGYDATRLLLDEGCRNLVHITANPRRNVYADRLAGFKQAMEEFGLPFKEESVIINDLSQEAGSEAAKLLLQMQPRPDGVFVANDNCAVGCILSLKEKGVRIPEEIAFVGFNNDPVASVVEPNLSTINYPGHKMGQLAAQSMIDHLNGKSAILSTETILLRSELVLRESSNRSAKQI